MCGVFGIPSVLSATSTTPDGRPIDLCLGFGDSIHRRNTSRVSSAALVTWYASWDTRHQLLAARFLHPQQSMRILIFGAGNIGLLYASRLAKSGHEVACLARGTRLDQLRRTELRLQNAVTGETHLGSLATVESLDPKDTYDLVLVTLGGHQLSSALPILKRNQRTPAVMFMGNTLAGPDALLDALGTTRVLLGFPGAAAIWDDNTLRYVITSSREQPTTVGEVHGGRTARIDSIAKALDQAGFSVAISQAMDAWLKTHAIEILPTALALYMAGCDRIRLAKTRDALVLMIRAIREGYRLLEVTGTPITPAHHRLFGWLPEPLLVPLIKRRLLDPLAAIKVGHAATARHEMTHLARELETLAGSAAFPMPATQLLCDHLGVGIAPIPAGSRTLALRWSPMGSKRG